MNQNIAGGSNGSLILGREFLRNLTLLNTKKNKDMTSRDFAFWLQGYFEIENPETIDAEKVDMIKRHLALVFKHEIDPSMPDPDGELQATHDGKPTYCEDTPPERLRC